MVAVLITTSTPFRRYLAKWIGPPLDRHGRIDSLNARYRRAVRARGHFPTEQNFLAVSVLDR